MTACVGGHVCGVGMLVCVCGVICVIYTYTDTHAGDGRKRARHPTNNDSRAGFNNALARSTKPINR